MWIDKLNQFVPALGYCTFFLQRSHVCDVCDRRFKKPSDLVRHKRIHTGNFDHLFNFLQ